MGFAQNWWLELESEWFIFLVSDRAWAPIFFHGYYHLAKRAENFLLRKCQFEASLFFNWIYWGDIGSQNHTGVNCTTQQSIICTLHGLLIAPSSLFTSHPPPLPTSTYPHPLSLWLSPPCCLSVCVMCAFLNLSTFFHPASQPPPLRQLSVWSMYPWGILIFVIPDSWCWVIMGFYSWTSWFHLWANAKQNLAGLSVYNQLCQGTSPH